jgi:proline iminopeptidase
MFLTTSGNHKIFYTVYGGGDSLPLVVCNGGPGFAHQYMTPLAQLSEHRPVVLYDQLGSGYSDRPPDPSIFTIEYFVSELEQLGSHLEYSSFHLLGHSWGSVLAAEYALAYPHKVRSLILGSPCISLPNWNRDVKVLIARLSPEARRGVQHARATGDYSTAEFQTALEEFDRKHLRGMPHNCTELVQSITHSGALLYTTMWGACEFIINGTLANYDGRLLLPRIACPTVYYCGRYDEATPRSLFEYASLTPKARLKVFPSSAHHPHLSERAAFRAWLAAELTAIDGGEFRAMSKGGMYLRCLPLVDRVL